MALNQVTDKILTEWIIDTGVSKKELASMAKLIRKEAKEEKDLDVVRQHLNKTTKKTSAAELKHKATIDKLNKSTQKQLALMKKQHTASMKSQGMFKKLNVGMTAASIKGNLYAMAISAITAKTGEMIKDAHKYNTALNAFTGNIELAREATKGYASDIDLMQASNRLSTLGVKLSGDEFGKLLHGVTKLSDAMGVDLKHGIESAAIAMSRQSIRVADNIGVVMKVGDANDKYAESIGKLTKNLTDSEKRLAFQKEFLTQINKKAGELPEKMATIGNATAKLSTSLSNSFTSMAAVVDRTLGESLDNIVDLIVFIRTGKSSRGAGQRNRLDDAAKLDEDIRGIKEGLRPGGGRTALGGGGGTDTSSLLFGSTMSYGRGRYKEGAEFSSQRDIMAEERAAAKAAARRKKKTPIGDPHSLTEKALLLLGIDPANLNQQIDMAKMKADQLGESTSNYLVALKKEKKATDKATEATEKAARAKEKEARAKSLSGRFEAMTTNIVTDTQVDLLNTASGAFGSLGSAMFAAADAAEATGESFASAMGKIVKATLKGIAITSAVKALEALALAAFNMAMMNPGPAALALKSAGMYAATAAAAGIASAIIPGGGGGSTAASQSRGRSSQSTSGPVARPNFTKKRKEVAPINIDVYIGDPASPTAALMMQKQVTAQLNQASQSVTSDL